MNLSTEQMKETSKANKQFLIGLAIVILLGILIYFSLYSFGIIGNKLTCRMNKTQDGVEQSIKSVFQFEDDKLLQTKMNGTLSIPKKSSKKDKESFQRTISFTDSMLKMIAKQDGFEIDSDTNSTSYEFYIMMEMSKIKENNIDINLSGITKDSTKKEVKEQLEKNGYRCK